MKRIAVILVVVLLGAGTIAQAQKLTKEQKKELEAKKKAEKAAKADSMYNATVALVESKKFTLQAEYIRDNAGAPHSVLQSLNFVAVDSVTGVVQIGSNLGFGYNGVGGATAEGKISRWQIERNDRKHMLNVYLTITARHDTYDLSLNIDYDLRATATLTGIKAGRLTFDGYLVPLDEAAVFKGMER
jgi:hypothetical protein